MTAGTPGPTTPEQTTPRQVADGYVDDLLALDPLLVTQLGVRPEEDRLPDWSPQGLDALAEAARAALARLEAVAPGGAVDALPDVERRCAVLLRERLGASLALHEAGEGLRGVSTLFSPPHEVRMGFLAMPREQPEHWEAVARRLRAVPGALASWTASLEEGRRRGLLAGPRQVEGLGEQLGAWLGGDGEPSFWHGLAAQAEVPDALRRDLEDGASRAAEGTAALRDYLRDTYAPAAAGQPDAVGRERYLLHARAWNGADLDLDDVWSFGWSEVARIAAEMDAEAGRVLPGAGVRAAMDHLDEHGEAVVGEEAVRARLQRLMDEAVEALDGTHMDLAEPVRRVEAMIAPVGSAAAPYYTPPSLDFSRPGRTWLPTQGRERFPWWKLVSVWYHEGVPGHHLQLAQWVLLTDQLSRYQTTVGFVGANAEGWALYAERLMDELGFLRSPAERLGYLEMQWMRAVRVVVDVGMHLGLRTPPDQPFRPGEPVTPELARELFASRFSWGEGFVADEITRYLGMPGQAVSYKLGERAWLAGRGAAREAAHARGEAFDLKAWHMAALSTGSLGLDDLARELAVLPRPAAGGG